MGFLRGPSPKECPAILRELTGARAPRAGLSLA